MLQRKYEQFVENVVISERFVLLTVGECTIINVYMPCGNGSQSALDESSELLNEISGYLEQINCKFFVFGGDMNTNLNDKNARQSKLISAFLERFNLCFVN